MTHQIACAVALSIASVVSAVPLPTDKSQDIITDRANFIPNQKHLNMPGKVVAVLAADAAAVLAAEGRAGPADQLCLGWNGGSYRWVYVPMGEKAQLLSVQMPLPDEKMKVYGKVSMASPLTVKSLGIESYALVEVEVNDGAGSPTTDSLVATKMRKVDGTKEYPIDIAAVIGDLKKRYESHLLESAKDLDAAMDAAAQKAIKDRKPTGPREKETIMFATWMPEAEKLIVRFRTKVIDGDYRYANNINIELAPAPKLANPVKGGQFVPPRFASLRCGTQFGIEYGMQFEVSKAGKIDKVKTLPPEAFLKEFKEQPLFKR